MIRRRLVLIRWIDAQTAHGWEPIEEAKDATGTLKCETVGWVIHRDKDKIVVAQTVSHDQVNGRIAIPVAWIQGDIITLKAPKP